MSPTELRRLCFDFRAARAVSAAVELGVFDALATGPADADALAAKLGANPRGLHILLDALAALGLLLHEEDGYTPSDAAQRALVPGGPEYMGNLLLHDLWHWSGWGALDSAVRDGLPYADRSHDRHLADPQVLARFLPNYNLAMEQSGAELVEPLAELLAALAPDSVLDLGGGSGALLLSALERVPEARGVLVDHGFALQRARQNASAHPARERLELCELDFEKQPIPSGHDLVVLARVLMGFGPGRAAQLVQRAAAALVPGGFLLVADFDASTRVGALLSLDMLLHTGGEVHGAQRFEQWFQDSGLQLEKSGHLLPYVGFWLGRKPW